MTRTRAGGPPAYRAAHKIAVIDGRLSFEQAYCLSRLVLDYGSGSAVPERGGVLSLKLCQELAAENLVLVTAEMISATMATVRLTVTPAMLDEIIDIPAPTIVVNTYEAARRRKKANWFVQVTQLGLDLVAAALEPS